jgi:uncharacterized protein (DUF1015 family)
MAKIFPFRALRHDPAKVSPAKVVTQPYDKITPEMQARYYSTSPYNLVRVVLGRQEAGDNDSNNVYTRAAANLQEWRAQHILVRDPEPSLYLYTQTYRRPDDPKGNQGKQIERRGFIALGQLEDYDQKIVHRHEQTLSKPKADRLNLLRSTQSHFGQIFMLYSDPASEVDTALRQPGPPTVEIKDEYNVVHRLWKVSEPAVIAAVQAKMDDKKLIIADGHHRYETALNYRNERRERGNGSPDAPYERVMMTFVNMDSPGVLVLPTHRVVFGLQNFDATGMIQKLGPYFEVEEIGPTATIDDILGGLRDSGKDRTALLAITSTGGYLLRSKPDQQSPSFEGLSEKQRSLDVVQLHKLILEETLGMSEEDIRNQAHIKYLRDFRDAFNEVRQGANVAFITNPVRIDQVRDVAFNSEVLPQKSTDFYPKLLTGLTIYTLDEQE